ncbi:MAG: PQQ-binding-like beta-propeller repeat protein [Steroidobacteraceae bacterium]|nr:PQQ-binding-like beta-propeller repeat protein [Steroidobacteraceae bacterium]MBP7615629.1 PQQ-binding-like beta-propeller repeat protein [Steroidobacteraceae bacterium]
MDEHPLAMITGTLQFFEDRLYVPVSSDEESAGYDQEYACCSFRGSLTALDAASGREIWKSYTVQGDTERLHPPGPERLNPRQRRSDDLLCAWLLGAALEPGAARGGAGARERVLEFPSGQLLDGIIRLPLPPHPPELAHRALQPGR